MKLQELDNISIKVLSELKKADSKAAFKLIVTEYSEKLYWHIRRIVLSHDDANDVLQNTFIKVWNGLEKFKGDAKIYTWLYRIATNESITFLTKNNKRIQRIEDSSYTEEPSTTQESIKMDASTIEQKLEQAILTLPEKQRIVFNLKYFEELKYEEIAKITATSVGALKASYHLAVKKIEKYLTTN